MSLPRHENWICLPQTKLIMTFHYALFTHILLWYRIKSSFEMSSSSCQLCLDVSSEREKSEQNPNYKRVSERGLRQNYIDNKIDKEMLKLSVILIKMLFIDINIHYCIHVVAREKKKFPCRSRKNREIFHGWERVLAIFIILFCGKLRRIIRWENALTIALITCSL